jgi:tRNA (cmo5U34)-methyltransferase
MKTTKNENRFITMARTYDEMAPFCVPAYDFMQDELLKLIPFSKDDTFILVDLGAGGGRFLEKVCKIFPMAQCFHVDSSDTFQQIAQNRLDEFKNRVTYIKSTLEAPWEDQIADKVDCIVSMNAIHHLTSEEKKYLYLRGGEKLNPKGIFFNSDEIRAEKDNVYLKNMIHWIEHVEHVGKTINAELHESYNSWCSHFDKWKERNITKRHIPKIKGDDIHCEVATQIQWMKEGKLSEVDIYVKYHLWAIFGGYKRIV